MGTRQGVEMSRLVIVFVLALVAFPARACSIEEVSDQILSASIKRAGELAEQKIILVGRFRAIANRAKDPDKPLSQQLSQADQAEFAQVQQRYQAVELQHFLESNYARDNSVIKTFYEVAQSSYLGAPVPKEGEENFLPYAFLAVMKAAADQLITVPGSKTCTMEFAIHEVENESFERLNHLPMADAQKDLKGLLDRNHVTKLDREQLGASDRAIYDRIQRTVYAPAAREESFIVDLESLKLLARSAALKFDLGRKDAIDSGGDINAVGKSVGALNLDARGRMGFNMLDKIAEKYPSDWLKQQQRSAPAIEAIERQDAARITSRKKQP